MTSPNNVETDVARIRIVNMAMEALNEMGQTVISVDKIDIPGRDIEAERELDYFTPMYARNIVAHYHEMAKAPHVGRLKKLFNNDTPVALVGAGPSLDKNAERLANFPGLIIAADRAAKPLTARGIRPDLILTIDPRKKVVADMLDYPESVDQTLVMSVLSDSDIANIWKGKIIYISQAHPGTQFFDCIMPAIFPGMPAFQATGNVGNTSFQLAWWIGCSPIVLVGQDYGYTDGKMHADNWEKNDGTWRRVQEDHVAKLEHRTGKTVINGVQTYAPFGEYMKLLKKMVDWGNVDLINATEGGILTDFKQMTLRDVNTKLNSNHGALERARSAIAKATGGQ